MYKRININKILKSIKQNSLSMLLTVLFIALLISQAYTFIDRGQILGFKVRTIAKESDTKAQVAKRSQKDVEQSLVCNTLSTDFIKQLVGSDFEQSTFYSDVKNNNRISNSTCLYISAAPDKKAVTVSFQEKENEDIAIKEVQKLKVKDGSKEIEGYQDEAYFNDGLNQLAARKGNRVVNVFIKVEPESNLNIQDIAKDITAKLLN